jgi:hypothetical protein
MHLESKAMMVKPVFPSGMSGVEYHVTVVLTNPVSWWNFCMTHGIKPLYIELNNFRRQAMCGAKHDPSDLIRTTGWQIIREKIEVNPLQHTMYADRAIYYEAHMKLRGHMDGTVKGASRDLYRSGRWYITRRAKEPFDPNELWRFRPVREEWLSSPHWLNVEYEACVYDTNEELDYGWI